MPQPSPYQAEQLANKWTSWVEGPIEAQEQALSFLLKHYLQTSYGRLHGAKEVRNYEDFRRRFPTSTYADLWPWINAVISGDFSSLLCEEPVAWGLTSGTRGPPKLIPLTRTDLELRRELSSMVLATYLSRTKRYGVFSGYVFAPHFPSRVGFVKTGDKLLPCGYISGIYAEVMSSLYQSRGIPSTESMNSVGASMDRGGWKRRLEALAEECLNRDVSMVVGAPFFLEKFGKFVEKRFGKPPASFWCVELILCAGEPKIHTKYAPVLKKLYGGKADVLEAYGATEGVFMAQIDEKPALSPFYGAILYEVFDGRGVKLLHQMKRGEMGYLVVSTPTLPRYWMGDVVLCLEDGRRFSVVGRDTLLNRLRVRANRWVRQL